jgi:ubiquinone/menaquinone biosynthesis C-methylase UbiE
MTWQGKWVRQRSGFKDATKILEVGAGAFDTTHFLASRYPGKEFYGVDFVLSPAALTTLETIPDNLTIVKHDARDLRVLAEGYFDAVFSVAVMEHIHELEAHLAELHRILKPGGLFWFWESPFWSSSMGHHYRHQHADCPIPHYGHLYMDREELCEYLREHEKLHELQIEAIGHQIYERGDLSRLTRAETRQIVEDSPFEVVTWEDEPDQWFDPDLAKKVLANNVHGVLEEDLPIKGAKACLQRPEAVHEAAPVSDSLRAILSAQSRVSAARSSNAGPALRRGTRRSGSGS